MSDVDRITDDGKRAIVSILNKGLAVEYAHIVNYPRFIDQMVNIDEVPDDDPCVVVLKQLVLGICFGSLFSIFYLLKFL